MSIQDDLAKKCNKYNIESIINDDELILICPKIPDESIQKEFKSLLPEGAKIQFVEGPKVATMEGLKLLFANVGLTQVPRIALMGHALILELQGTSQALTEKESQVWEAASSVLIRDPYIETWKITVNGTVMSEYNKVLAEMVARQTRPKRDLMFTNDELLNLRISLESCQTVDDFINSI